jgi:hypothetical protein
MPGRKFNTPGYRYGFNGQEMDNEINSIDGAYTSAEYWQYDARLGRRWNVDPKASWTRGWTPYHSNLDNPVYYKDPNGDFIPFLVYAFLAGTIIDAGIQASVNYSINPELGWEVAMNRIDWGDALVTGGITAMTAGTASEITIGKSVTSTITRKLSEATIKGEIIKATIDYSPANPNQEERLQIAIINKDNKKVAIDLTFGCLGNEATESVLKEFKISTQADLDVIKQKNNMKPADRTYYKLMDNVANSATTSEIADKTTSYVTEGLGEALNQRLESYLQSSSQNNDQQNTAVDNSDKIKQQFEYIQNMNKEINKLTYQWMKTANDKTKVETEKPKSIPRFR